MIQSETTVQPIISLITVCLNSKATIARTIESVIDQKMGNVEYIIIDGGSTDGTQEIVQNYGRSVDIFVSEPDRGISDGFNKGISLAHGSIIGLINSDDCLLPGSLQKIMDYFHKNPACQVVHGDLLLYRGDVLVKQLAPAGRWWYPWRLVLFNHPATFVRRSVYEILGLFSLDYRIAMDVDIFLRWLRSGIRMDYLPEPLVVMHYGGLSGSLPFDGYQEARRAFIKHGFPWLPVWLLYVAKCLLHGVARIQAVLPNFGRKSMVAAPRHIK